MAAITVAKPTLSRHGQLCCKMVMLFLLLGDIVTCINTANCLDLLQSNTEQVWLGKAEYRDFFDIIGFDTADIYCFETVEFIPVAGTWHDHHYFSQRHIVMLRICNTTLECLAIT